MEIQINQTDFSNVIENNNNVLLDFYADWCGPCRTLLPTIHKLADELKDHVAIKKINVDNNQELAAKFGIRNIPTLVFIKDGKAVEKHTGLITEKNLRDKIDRLK
ncbi:thioredoxin [Polaribacter sp. Z022]|uniref:thioredoxin n=1 Tax=Polaribacter sp. Z022 TaxID=2927125 RepID=UPI0020205175|nr:thioredoxin [Polaribacter sp. Z022]MCL7752398.1 thioredoxin [Polaribacter sp. Z022]